MSINYPGPATVEPIDVELHRLESKKEQGDAIRLAVVRVIASCPRSMQSALLCELPKLTEKIRGTVSETQPSEVIQTHAQKALEQWMGRKL